MCVKFICLFVALLLHVVVLFNVYYQPHYFRQLCARFCTLYRCSNHQPCVYLCVFFVPQHGVRRPVLSIFLPSIHSAVAAATIFSAATACMLHIRIFSNGSMYVGVRGKSYKKIIR